MKTSIRITYIVLALALIKPSLVSAVPNAELVERALLQQLHAPIQSSLHRIYDEVFSQFRCVRIVSINERVTNLNKTYKVKPADAIHGANYFEIKVGLVRINGEYIELTLKNDTATGEYGLIHYNKGSVPADFICK